MAAIHRWRGTHASAACLVLFALTAIGTARSADEPEFPSPASTPVDVIRRQFEATATPKAIDETLGVVGGLHDADGKVIPSACKARAHDLLRAARHDPLSLAVWYYQARCAEALGNHALQEQSEKAFAVLVRDAFAGIPPDNGLTPLHVESTEDGNAIIDATDETVTFSYLDMSDLGLGLFWRAGLLDPDTGRERRLSFEFLQRRLQLIRDPQLLMFPLGRLLAERDIAEKGVKDSVKPPAGVPRTLEYLDELPTDQKAARLKALIAGNGPSVPHVLARYCFSHPDAGCNPASVDALLPLAEEHRAEPMILLAYAQANGLGVKSDESAAKVLLQGAAKHEDTGAVYESYLELDANRVADANPFERWVYTQVSAAADAGDKLAAGEAVWLAAMNPDYEKDASRLQRWQHAADAVGLVDFTYDYCIATAQKAKDGPAEIRCAERLGDRRHGALMLAKAYERGDLPGVPADPAKALYWRKQAAILGDPASMRIIGRHYAAESKKPDSLVLAGKWYLSATYLFDLYAMLDLAKLSAGGKIDPVAGPKAAKLMYEAMLKSPGELGPSIRRNFAEFLATGSGIERDPDRARALLLQDANSGDPYSELELANLLYAGSLGPRDPASASAWIEKALSANKTPVNINVATELYQGVRLAPDKARAIALWTRAAQQQGGEIAWNDMAWELCTNPEATKRDPKSGLEAAVKATSKNPSPSWRDTLAACQAATGDFDSATASEQRALADADPDSDLAINLRARIDLYRNHQAYVQPPYNSAVMR